MDTTVSGNKCCHVGVKYGNLGRYVILLDDPECIPKILPFFDSPQQTVQNPDYNIYTGKLSRQTASVCCTGKGGSAAATAATELIGCGVDAIIRVGTCVSLRGLVNGGHLVIAQAAIRAEDASYEYLPQGYPAIANFAVTSALAQAAEELLPHAPGEEEYHIGMVRSKDSYYSEMTPDGSADINNFREDDRICGCLAGETACAAVYTVGHAHSSFPREVRCGGVLTVLRGAQLSEYPDWQDKLTADALLRIKCAVRAMKLIIEEDRRKYNRCMDRMHGLVR